METRAPMEPVWIDYLKQHAPGFAGAVLYFFYMRVYHSVPLRKSLVSLLAGWMMASFLGPQVAKWLPGWDAATLGFLVGFMGMKLAEGFVSVDVKAAVKRTIEKPLK